MPSDESMLHAIVAIERWDESKQPFTRAAVVSVLRSLLAIGDLCALGCGGRQCDWHYWTDDERGVCDQCGDAEAAALVSSSARPDRQTVEQAKEAHGEAVQAFRLAKVGPELAEAGLGLASTLQVLIAAVRQEQADARPARTLKLVVGEMLTIYGVKFDDANSREVAIDTWARQLVDALLSGGGK